MPLPQKAIEQIGREPPKTPGWSWRLLMFSNTIFIVALFVYLGLVFGYKPYLNKQVSRLQDQIQAFGEEVPADQQAQIIRFYSQIANLKTILASHVSAAPIFGWLEKNTQANVYWTSFKLDVSGGNLSLSGFGGTMADVTQQLAILQSLPEISSMSVSGASQGDGGWQFGVNLTFRSGYFSPAAIGIASPTSSSQSAQ